jgi:phage tail sheath protein FI
MQHRMAKKLMTPGVYIEEKNAFPSSVVEVATAIPAFIGYTEKAERHGKNLVNKPVRITSLAEYNDLFGGGFKTKFELTPSTDDDSKPVTIINGTAYALEFAEHQKAFMYPSMKLFYANGGGTCYIVSVGIYKEKDALTIDMDELLGTKIVNDTIIEGGLETLKKEQEPAIVVIPDAVNLPEEQCYTVYREVLKHCANMQSRVTILDIHNGFQERIVGGDNAIIEKFRNAIGSENLSYGAAYYPWLHTSSIEKNELSLENIKIDVAALSKLLAETTTTALIDAYLNDTEINEQKTQALHLKLMATSPSYVSIIDTICTVMNLLPPSSAMAGLYTMVDNSRGVWKSPANIPVANVVKPSVVISHEDQENLNLDALSGKSINAIRTFPGVGTMVWGGRTLDGNSLDWRYINVRRTMIMLEQSIKLALRAYVFEPNTANTWVTVKSMIENFLTGKWKQGALAGAAPEDAFEVQVGLGTTMTGVDILKGKLLITVKLAIVRPAEFIVVTFQQQMQKS